MPGICADRSGLCNHVVGSSRLLFQKIDAIGPESERVTSLLGLMDVHHQAAGFDVGIRLKGVVLPGAAGLDPRAAFARGAEGVLVAVLLDGPGAADAPLLRLAVLEIVLEEHAARLDLWGRRQLRGRQRGGRQWYRRRGPSTGQD